MQLSLITALLLAQTLPGSAGESLKLPLREDKVRIRLTLDENSIVRDAEDGIARGAICSLALRTDDLKRSAVLRKTAAQGEFRLSAGRWCLVQPLERLVEEFRLAGGSLEVDASLSLIESRYEVERAHGDPGNIGKCNRSLIEGVAIHLPDGRKTGFFEEQKIQAGAPMESCFARHKLMPGGQP